MTIYKRRIIPSVSRQKLYNIWIILIYISRRSKLSAYMYHHEVDIATGMVTIKDDILLCLHRSLRCDNNGRGKAEASRKYLMRLYDVVHDHVSEAMLSKEPYV